MSKVLGYDNPMKIAIVGSGIAGLTCAHVLGPHHDVSLFEADSRVGGHSNTVIVHDPVVGDLGVDTGFIVHNDRNYPNLTRLFSELGVETVDTEMSFGVADEQSGFAYRATNLNSLLADRRNIVRPQLYRMLFDIGRFYRSARRFLASGDETTNLGEFLSRGHYSPAFVDLHLIPMGASIWSADPASFDEFPARSLLSFLDNHGLLSVRDRPQWKAIVGGSQQYVNQILERFEGEVHTQTPVLGIQRRSDNVEIHTEAGTVVFDAVVIACHSDQALNMLTDPSTNETEVLGAIRYQKNKAILHTDTAVLPPQKLAHSAWNYFRRADGSDVGAAVLTYDMTDLMKLPVTTQYLVSLNDHRIDPSKALYETTYRHPVFDGPAIAAQRRVAEISGTNRTHFAGAYWGFGFHEDGMASGLRACAELGSPWEFESEPVR